MKFALTIGAILSSLLLAGCGRAEGAKFLSGDLTASELMISTGASLPENVEPAALNAVISYVDALNIGLHTGNVLPIRMSAMAGCGCLKIANNFVDIYRTSNLIGGQYKITSIAPTLNTPEQINLKVRVAMSETKHVNRKSRAIEIWEASNIDTVFVLRPVNGEWWIEQSE